MIEAAVILSAVVQHWPDFVIILVLLLLERRGRLLGGAPGRQRHRRAEGQAGDEGPREARRRVDRRRRRASWCRATCIRLRLGDIVPADARLLEGDPVEVDQSALTGESLPATRKSGEAVFSGSILRQGEIDALVYATGHEHLFRQDRAAGPRGAHRQPLPEGGAEDRQLPHRARSGRWSR